MKASERWVGVKDSAYLDVYDVSEPRRRQATNAVYTDLCFKYTVEEWFGRTSGSRSAAVASVRPIKAYRIQS